MLLSLFFLAPILVFISFRSYGLLRNYIAARRLKLPIIVLPCSFEDPWWILLKPLFWWVERLPLGLGDWYPYTDLGWPVEDVDKTVSRLGETFVLVSPNRNEICTAYPPAVRQIYKDMKTFIMPAPFSQAFAFFGQNVSSVNGAEWQRHRRITAPAFNEQTMRFVWEESVEQTAASLGLPVQDGSYTIADIRSDFNVLAMRVLTTVGFGQDAVSTTLSPGHKQTMLDSLGFILKHVFTAIIFVGVEAPDVLLPPILRQLKSSVREFKLYMEELVLGQLQKSRKASDDKPSKTSLLEAMVNANEAEKDQNTTPVGKPSYLTDSELYGNLFVFSLAGYETTAGTMTFALPYLALHPEIQDWVIEEVDLYYTHTRDRSYQEVYPKLVRCLAVMYETLRLAGPAAQMVRTPIAPTELPIGTKDMIIVEPDTLITALFSAMHASPRWGADVHVFNPRRFVATDPNAAAGGQQAEGLTMPSDTDNAMFLAWVFGPRVCPGKKFSQVEFVAVVAQILSQYRIEVLIKEGQTAEEAKRQLSGVLGEKIFNVSTHLKRPGDAGVRFVRRAF